MTREKSGEDLYETIKETTGGHTYAHNIANVGNQGNSSGHGGPEVLQQPSTTPDFVYLENSDVPATPAPITDQRLQQTASPVPHVVPQNQTQATNSYPQTLPPAAINQSYIPEQHPPSYNEVFGKGHPSSNFGPHTQQPQPWGQQFHPNYHNNVTVTTQPQPTPPNMMIVNPTPQRNASQGLATASLVMAIFGVCCCFCSIFCTIPAIVLAAISLCSTDPEKAKTLANISMLCTVVGWISGIIAVIVYVVVVATASYQ
ncbi:hypothetical protein HOLleu_30521 [Holothuria leucospilota]|uniref:DUF4190 domain-containing protein n=1 Tax=Holothuria leucospilota TaxID=206669 RepID=A0A9Q1GZQ2_HOLLE|nr:hypothetical protein HOLleu_30521 [Holothuria leucospilota]